VTESTPTLEKEAPASAPAAGARRWLAAAGAAAALGLAAWFFGTRPSPLEKARRALDRATPDAAVQILTKRLAAAPPATEETDLRRELARAYLMKGAGDDAESALRLLLDKNPSDGEAQLSLGFLFFSRGQDAAAVDALQKAKTLLPQDLRASRGLLALFNFRGDFDKARAEALELLNHAPTDAAARRGLGEAELGRGLFGDAAQAFDAALQAVPEDADARRGLTAALLGAGDLAAAEQALTPLLKESPDDAAALALQADYFLARSRPSDAESLYQRIFEKDPRRALAGAAWARCLARRGDTDRAEELLLDIAQRLPRPEDVPPVPYADFYAPWNALAARRSVRETRVAFNRAMAAVYRARYLAPDAERQARLALQMAPSDVGALRLLTDIQRASGDGAAWRQAAADAADKLPLHPQVILDKAESLLAGKKSQDALTLAQAAAAACPGLSRAHAVLAETRLSLGDKEAAARAVEKGLSLNDRDPAVRLADGLLKAARNEWTAAERAFAEAADLDPALARAHWERGRALQKLGRSREARDSRDRALALEPRAYAGRP
jgi:Flp pilus assembly protein TadD